MRDDTTYGGTVTEGEAGPEEQPSMQWSGFLESVAPGQWHHVGGMTEFVQMSSEYAYFRIQQPDLQLHCDSDTCGDDRIFECTGCDPDQLNGYVNFFMTYRCRNCRESEKHYAIRGAKVVEKEAPPKSAAAFKLGELPTFGPRVPNRVLSLFGGDRELFLRGRRAENQGLGIGAYAYYRQVVGNHKQRLFDEIADVAERLGSPPDKVKEIRAAADDWRFGRSVDRVEDVIPNELYIEGHNPLTLLHNALSKGLHEGTDKQCLELARAVRLVLTDLTETMDAILDEKQELKDAVSRLMNDELVTGGD